ncbi:hypothetical protein NLU13_9814 [Sarocladium strictum]|uniref:MARVEL domain-containing protein n=1 Tax=Sarocladium strictum TaxID=5046 RepID=A0AA39G8N3_SARSR|nr:hypothetical protein NLU13_9814 [Sarocladium strictum]
MEFGIITIVHAVLALFLIIELGLTGAIVDQTFWTPSSFSFLLFCAIWSILVLLYLALTPRFFPRAYHTLVALGLLVVTTIFWFAGSIAVAARIGTHCGGNSTCQTAQAATAFGFFIWAIFTGLTVLEGLAFNRGGGGATADVRSKPATYPGA